MFKQTVVFVVCVLVSLNACKKKENVPPPPKNQTQTTSVQSGSDSPKFDACALITTQEIEAIEQSPVKDTKNSGRSDQGLASAQCFYTTETFNKSVSLAVTKPDPDATPKRSIKEYWEGMFGKFENEGKEGEHEGEKLEHAGDKEKSASLREQRKEREEEHESVPPKKIEGVGDEAFWIASRVGGALYVLGKDSFVRVSVGGPDPEEKKIEKCKALAQKALGRL